DRLDLRQRRRARAARGEVIEAAGRAQEIRVDQPFPRPVVAAGRRGPGWRFAAGGAVARGCRRRAVVGGRAGGDQRERLDTRCVALHQRERLVTRYVVVDQRKRLIGGRVVVERRERLVPGRRRVLRQGERHVALAAGRGFGDGARIDCRVLGGGL